MRNTNQHPITDDEIIATLQALSREIIAENERFGVVGDHRPLILQAAVLRIISSKRIDNPAQPH